jgi:SAM-dependent methyltransferase
MPGVARAVSRELHLGYNPTEGFNVPELYDDIGVGYVNYRRPDPRIAAAIMRALGDLAPVVNVGAGTGSYEPEDRPVVAVEPSLTMIRQRRDRTVPVVRASAMNLPFDDDAFAAALAVLTIHHWPDRARGLSELARVTRHRLVFLTYDPAAEGFWLVNDYFPEIKEFDRRHMPPLEEFRRVGRSAEVNPLPIPHDCSDGFLGAYWRRPSAYLDPGVRGSISAFSKLSDVDAGLSRLRSDLADGTWERRHGHLSSLTALDLGYRLIVVNL